MFALVEILLFLKKKFWCFSESCFFCILNYVLQTMITSRWTFLRILRCVAYVGTRYFLNELSDYKHVLRYYIFSVLLRSSLHLNMHFTSQI